MSPGTRSVRLSLLLMLTASSIIAACVSGCQNDQAAPEPGAAIIVLVDFSGTTTKDREFYKQTMDNIVSSLGRPNDHLVVAGISADSRGDWTSAVNVTFPPPEPAKTFRDNSLAYTQRLRRRAHDDSLRVADAREQALQFIDAARAAPRTAIIESIRAAKEAFAPRTGEQVILVVLSDMLESAAAGINLESKIDGEKADSLVADLDSKGLVPDLTGWKVHVAGASGVDMAHDAAVKRFWLGFFDRAHASVAHYGRAMLDFAR